MRPSIRTVGHGTLDEDDFVALLRRLGVEVLVDVRRYPGSRRFPHFSGDRMATWLPAAGIGYEWLPALGGRRRATADSPNVALRNAQFRAYADHMASAEFAGGIARVLEVAATRTTAVMCAESVWWRCHRRLVADHLGLVEGCEVVHGYHDGRLEPHRPQPEARRVDDHLVYDVTGEGP